MLPCLCLSNLCYRGTRTEKIEVSPITQTQGSGHTDTPHHHHHPLRAGSNVFILQPTVSLLDQTSLCISEPSSQTGLQFQTSCLPLYCPVLARILLSSRCSQNPPPSTSDHSQLPDGVLTAPHPPGEMLDQPPFPSSSDFHQELGKVRVARLPPDP